MKHDYSEWLFPRTSHVHKEWFVHWFSLDPAIINTLSDSQSVSRQANKFIRAYCGEPLLPQSELPRKICRLNEASRQMLTTGLAQKICAQITRTIVDGDLIRLIYGQTQTDQTPLMAAIDDPIMIELLESTRGQFIQTCQRGELGNWITSVGALLLEALMGKAGEFVTRRVSLSVAPVCWRKRPRILLNTQILHTSCEQALNHLEVA